MTIAIFTVANKGKITMNKKIAICNQGYLVKMYTSYDDNPFGNSSDPSHW